MTSLPVDQSNLYGGAPTFFETLGIIGNFRCGVEHYPKVTVTGDEAKHNIPILFCKTIPEGEIKEIKRSLRAEVDRNKKTEYKEGKPGEEMEPQAWCVPVLLTLLTKDSQLKSFTTALPTF